MSTTIGQQAEDMAAQYLLARKYKILARNWKNRFCEIDIVAKKGDVVHFVEVKFRKSARSGSGLEYITKYKQHQLRYAALNWITENNWTGDYQIDALAVDNQVNPQITFIKNALGFS